MYRLLILLLTLSLLPLACTAEALPVFADDLTGMYVWPQDASPEEATYVYRYCYPQLLGDSSVALLFNDVYQYLASDALAFECPMYAPDHPAELGQKQVSISYEIVHQSDTLLSIRLEKTVTVGSRVTQSVSGNTFSLTGTQAGTITSLPYLLGLVEVGETDEWLIDRQITKLDECVRELVWERIQKDMRHPDSAIYDDLTYDEFSWSFYPEQDFYLDEQGNLVFFIQQNFIAPPEAGQFFYTISVDELLDEI